MESIVIATASSECGPVSLPEFLSVVKVVSGDCDVSSVSVSVVKVSFNFTSDCVTCTH